MGSILNPYRYVSAGGTLVQDTFTDSDTSPLTRLSAHTPDIDLVGGGWTEVAGTFVISSNTAKQTTIGGQSACIIDAGAADATLNCDLYLGLGSQPARLIFRYASSSSYWVAEIHNIDGFRLRYWSGSFSVLDTGASSISLLTWYTVTVTLSGNSISCLLDGADEIGTSSATNNTATVHGIGGFSSSQSFDNFIITS